MSLYVRIKKSFGDFTLDVDFQSGDGISGFLGASGSGKSMTLKCIAGIVTPDEGKIILNDRVLFDSKKHINLSPQKRRVGYLFQNYALFPNMTVEKNIEMGGRWQKDKEKRCELVSEMIRRMRLEGLEKRKPHELSGGQQQRTALARILVNQPEILLLDEPFSAMDSYLREQLAAEIKTVLKSYGKDVILVTHSRDELYKLCENAAHVERGKIRGCRAVKELFASPGSVQGAALTGCKNIAGAEKTGDHEVYVPDWNMHFRTAEPVGEDLEAVGIRAHYFTPACTENAGEVILEEAIEEPFEWTLKFRYKNSSQGSPAVWWRMPKAQRPECFPQRIGVAKEYVMLLYSR